MHMWLSDHQVAPALIFSKKIAFRFVLKLLFYFSFWGEKSWYHLLPLAEMNSVYQLHLSWDYSFVWMDDNLIIMGIFMHNYTPTCLMFSLSLLIGLPNLFLIWWIMRASLSWCFSLSLSHEKMSIYFPLDHCSKVYFPITATRIALLPHVVLQSNFAPAPSIGRIKFPFPWTWVGLWFTSNQHNSAWSQPV